MKTHSTAKKLPSPSRAFPAAWLWLVDELVTSLVKQRYSPRESWRLKPFSKEDAIFFSRGISELSELFTEDRPASIPAYFQHPRFRSAYLLYFLPLQMAKFLHLFEAQPGAMTAMLEHAKRAGKLTLLDVGAGPGTASIAVLLWLLDRRELEIPLIELQWTDTNAAIMEDGRAIVEQLCNQFPRLRGKVTLKTSAKPWWEVQDHTGFSLGFWGHVLNESRPPQRAAGALEHKLESLQGGGFLFLEPAARPTAQNLSQLRDQWIAAEVVKSIWGPCLHVGACPLAQGRDWCHFSMPVEIPGKWFKSFSKALSSERHWIKFSYVWVASPEFPAPAASPSLRRVISDPLRKGPGPSAVLVCEPEAPTKLQVGPREPLWRGSLVDLKTRK